MILFVISESSITYMVLYSIYWSVSLFFKFAEALKCLCTQRGALNQTEKWRRALSKGNPLTVITSYHVIHHHQMHLCFISFCTAVLHEYAVAIVLKKYIYKDLAFMTWLFNVSLLSPQIAESQTQHCCALIFLTWDNGMVPGPVRLQRTNIFTSHLSGQK